METQRILIHRQSCTRTVRNQNIFLDRTRRENRMLKYIDMFHTRLWDLFSLSLGCNAYFPFRLKTSGFSLYPHFTLFIVIFIGIEFIYIKFIILASKLKSIQKRIKVDETHFVTRTTSRKGAWYWLHWMLGFWFASPYFASGAIYTRCRSAARCNRAIGARQLTYLR
jgi:hypothetical protein